jgi:hypothetical protein
MMQLLPARQRAALILREVLGWSAKETADLLDTSVASVNSALQRARATLDEERPDRSAARTTGDLSETERRLLAGFIDAHERADPAAAAELVSEDIRITMPPHPFLYDGLDAIQPLLERGFRDHGDWRLLPTRANRMPAAANYLRAPGDTVFRAFKVDVLRATASPRSRRSRPRCFHSSAFRRRSEPGRITRVARGVALLVVALLATAAPARAAPVDVRVMTFNVWLGGDVVDFGGVIRARSRRRAPTSSGSKRRRGTRAGSPRRSGGRTGATACTWSRGSR